MARRWKKPGEHAGLAWVGMILVLAALASTGVAAWGARAERWDGPDAIGVIPYAIGLAALGLVIALLARFRRGKRGDGLAVVAVLLGVAFLGMSATDVLRAAGAPALKDITTDLHDPPRFASGIRPDAHEGTSPGDRPGFERLNADERWLALHAEAYPGLSGITLRLPPTAARARVEQAVAAVGWKVRRRTPEGIEAEARTFLFHLTDDIMIRVRAVPGGSRIDVRSVRRHGPDDRGQGVRNIRKLLNELQG